MTQFQQSTTINTELSGKEEYDPITEYEQWRSRTWQLLMEADDAREKGKLKKADRLMSEARKITQDYYDSGD